MEYLKIIILATLELFNTTPANCESLVCFYENIEYDVESYIIKRADYHEDALWIARTMLTEDVKYETWELIGSIIINRLSIQYNNKDSVYDVVHDRKQFSAVNTSKWRRTYSKLRVGSSEDFDLAYELALSLLIFGIPKQYEGVTHTYYRPAMRSLYRKSYPRWDSPRNRMSNRGTLDGWIYGTTLEYYGVPASES